MKKHVGTALSIFALVLAAGCQAEKGGSTKGISVDEEHDAESLANFTCPRGNSMTELTCNLKFSSQSMAILRHKAPKGTFVFDYGSDQGYRENYDAHRAVTRASENIYKVLSSELNSGSSFFELAIKTPVFAEAMDAMLFSYYTETFKIEMADEHKSSSSGQAILGSGSVRVRDENNEAFVAKNKELKARNRKFVEDTAKKYTSDCVSSNKETAYRYCGGFAGAIAGSIKMELERSRDASAQNWVRALSAPFKPSVLKGEFDDIANASLKAELGFFKIILHSLQKLETSSDKKDQENFQRLQSEFQKAAKL